MTTDSAVPELSVGIDLVRVSETRRSLDAFGERFLKRVFTSAEVEQCGAGGALSEQRLAARMAAKEAAIKVLRPSGKWLDPRSIELVRQPAGWPELWLHGEARQLAEARGLSGFSVSISHEGDYATAVVVAVRRSGLRS